MAVFVLLAEIVTIFLVGLSLAAIFLYKKAFDYWKVRGIPSVKPQLFYGNSEGVGLKFHMADLLHRVYYELKDQGTFGGFHVFFRPTAIITNLDLVKAVLIKDFNFFCNRGFFFNPIDDPLSEHVANIEDDQWRNERSKQTPAFSGGNLKKMFEAIRGISNTLVETIDRESDASTSIEVKQLMTRFMCDVIGNVAFGIDCDSLNDENARMHEMVLKRTNSYSMFQNLLMMRFKNLSRALRFKLIPDDINTFYRELVNSIVKYRNQNENLKRDDLISRLMKMMKNGEITMDQVTAHSFFYFAAGYETASSTLTFCIYELSRNQEIQEKARAEVREVLENHQDQLTYEAVNELDLVEKIIKETMRMWPPSASVQRLTSANYKVPKTNFVIEKDCIIIVPINEIHHDPSYYPDPEKFDPSRFNKDEVAKRHPFAYLPFGGGQRTCPASRFALLETKTAIAKLLMTYQFSLDFDFTELPLKIAPKGMMIPRKGVFVTFNKL